MLAGHQRARYRPGMKTIAGIGLVLGALALVVASGCKKDSPLDGIGDFRFGKSTLGDWGYACQPPENGKTFCQANPLEKSHYVSLGGQNASAGAVFAGTEKTAPLEELELYVEACEPEKLRGWLESTFGKTTESSNNAAFWEQKVVLIAAKLKGPECVVKMVESKNAERVAKLKAWK